MAEQLSEEIQLLEERLRRDPHSLMFARLADAYLQAGRVDEAKQLCEEGTREHPYYATGHVVLGKCYLEKGEHDAAEREFKRALSIDPNYLAAHKYYGDLMREIGWIKTFEMSYRKILQIDPLDQMARNMLGNIDLSQEPAVEEEEVIEEYLEEPEEPVRGEVEEGVAESVEPEIAAEPGEISATPEPETGQRRDEAKEEEFSGILDDIFKDEILDEDVSPAESHEVDTLQKYSEQLAPSDTSEFEFEVGAQEQPKAVESETAEPEPAATASETAAAELDAEEDIDVEELIETSAKEPPGTDEVELEDVIEPLQEPEAAEPVAEEAPPQMAAVGVDESELAEAEPPPSTDDSERGVTIVTPTLGEIYAAQGQFAKALEVYRKLIEKDPKNENFRKKIQQLEQKLAESTE